MVLELCLTLEQNRDGSPLGKPYVAAEVGGGVVGPKFAAQLSESSQWVPRDPEAPSSSSEPLQLDHRGALPLPFHHGC